MNNSILYSEINGACILILFLLSVKIRHSMFIQAQKRLLWGVTISNILLFALDAIWIFVNNSVIQSTILLNWTLNYGYYILSGVTAYFWFLYSETVQESKLVQEKKYRILCRIPFIILMVLTMTSYKTGWLFYIDAQNIYHRGPAYAIQLLSTYGYVVFTAIKALYLSFQADDFRRKTDLRILFNFVIPTLITGGLQVVFSGYPILCIGNTLGILYVYLTMQEQLVSVDALTRLNNRNQLYQYLSSKLAHPNHNKTLYLLIMDVDYFKAVNDKYGHIEGDNALKLVAKALMKSCGNRNFFISRFGGDEFIVLCELERNDSVETVCNAIHVELKKIEKPYELSVSIGYAKYTPDIKNQQSFIARADAELYKVKKARK